MIIASLTNAIKRYLYILLKLCKKLIWDIVKFKWTILNFFIYILNIY